MLLAKITANSILHRVSIGGVALTHFWDGYIKDFDAPQYTTAEAYGGFCEFTYGSITLSPDMFTESSIWPPPVLVEIELLYTDTTEEDAISIFEGTGHISAQDKYSVEYELYGVQYEQEILDEDLEYRDDGDYTDAENIALPRAFGTINYAVCTRLQDRSGLPTYSMGSVVGTTADCGTTWDVRDDGVSIAANVTANGDNTFSLSTLPVGEVTISGSSAQTTLADVFAFACESINLDLTIDTSAARTASPEINCWIDSQDTIISFLSKIASYFTHLFYIKGTTLYLVDLLQDNGWFLNKDLDDFDFFQAPHTYEPPIKSIKTEWIKRVAESSPNVLVKDKKEEVKRLSEYSYGQEKNVDCYDYKNDDDNKSRNNTHLDNILNEIHKAEINISIQMQDPFPQIGEKITWTDSVMGVSGNVRIRGMQFDHASEKLIVFAKGSIS